MQPIDKLMQTLTTVQKADLVSGLNAWKTFPISELGIPAVLMTDGPHGLRKQYDDNTASFEPSIPATCFPPAATLASSFDPDLIFEVGRAIGEEARDQDIGLVLGPGINIKRSPLCGRNFEYYSEDPLLSGLCGSALIRGLQSVGVGACVKHFAANNREYFRMVSNSIIDERALREIYLRGFEKAVRTAKPYAVMSAYNLLNNVYCGERKELLGDILRQDWGFSGIVISDWGACYNRVHSLQAGMDLEMPYSGQENTERIVKAVKDCDLDVAALDASVERILQFVRTCTENAKIPYTCSYESHHDLARKAARESTILLKNEKNLLPLPEGKPVALIGAFAVEPRYQGAGSSMIVPKHLESAYEVFAEYGIPYEYAQGYALDSSETRNSGDLRDEAVAAAKRAGTAVILAGLPTSWEFEGVDRENLELPYEQNELIRAVAAEVPTVVLLCCGAPVLMPWLDDVAALLHCYLGGEAGASAAAELLTGRATPCGRLAETYPLRLEDTPCCHFFRDSRHNVEYRESVYVGYSYYEAAEKDVLFPFGFGLSYTSFEWTNFKLDRKSEGDMVLSLRVRNTGERPGADIVEAYARPIHDGPIKLAGFQKVFLQPGEEKLVEVQLDEQSFQFYGKGWHHHDCDLLVGRNVRDILHTQTVSFSDAQEAPAYAVSRDGRWTMEGFYALFDSVPSFFMVERPFTLNATLADLQVAPAGSMISAMVKKYAEPIIAKDEPPETKKIMMKYIEENPMRALVSLSGGIFSYGVAGAILMIANGTVLLGMGRLGVELRKSKKRKPKRVR